MDNIHIQQIQHSGDVQTHKIHTDHEPLELQYKNDSGSYSIMNQSSMANQSFMHNNSEITGVLPEARSNVLDVGYLAFDSDSLKNLIKNSDTV